MRVETMRQWIKTAYPVSDKWTLKIEKMTDEQVMAIYWSLIKRKKIKGG